MSDLRYTLQYRSQRERRWKHARSWDAAQQDYRVVERVMQLYAREHPTTALRILEMPYNVLAAALNI